MKYCALISLLLFSITAFAHSWEPCQGHAGEYCSLNLSDIHPTQNNVGYDEVKMDKLPPLIAAVSRCDTENNRASCYDKSLQPLLTNHDELLQVVYGFDQHYYLIDGHHHAYALWLLYHHAGLCSSMAHCHIPVYVHIVHNYANNDFDHSEFWQKMRDENDFWPYTYSSSQHRYIPFSPDNLPSTISDMGNDPYRSIMGLARKWGGFSKPKRAGSEFYQFKWAACALALGDHLGMGKYPTDHSQAILNAIWFLNKNANKMTTQCVGPEYSGMPRPQRK